MSRHSTATMNVGSFCLYLKLFLNFSDNAESAESLPDYLKCQISSLYCSIVLSDEKNPAFAMLISAFLFHAA